MSNIINKMSSFIVDTHYDNLSSEVIDSVKMLLLDSMGCGLVSVSTDRGKMSIDLAKQMGGAKEASIIGIGDKVSNVNASFVNAELINSADYDALMMPGGHVPPYVIPPAMAVAESKGLSGKDLILALALGLELAVRVPAGIIQHRVYEEDGETKFSWGKRWGQSWTNFGTTAGVAKLLGLSPEQTANSLGISGHLCQVLTHVRFTYSDDRPLTKYGMPGWQNTGAIMAALAADIGYTGDKTVFDGEYGFFDFSGYEGELNLPAMIDELGSDWQFTAITYKPYPCCRMLHGGVDCLSKIIKENRILPEEVEKIRVKGHPTIDMPVFQHKEVNSVVDAQFNAAYVFSVVGNGIPAGPAWQDYTTMSDPTIREMMSKITFEGHPEYFAKAREDMSQQLWTVDLHARGQVFHEETLHPRGTVGKPGELTTEDLIGKFRVNACRALTQWKIDKAIDQLMNLETVNDISDLIKNLVI